MIAPTVSICGAVYFRYAAHSIFDMRQPDVQCAAEFGQLARVYTLSRLDEFERAEALNQFVVHTNPGISSSKRGRGPVKIPTGGTRA